MGSCFAGVQKQAMVETSSKTLEAMEERTRRAEFLAAAKISVARAEARALEMDELRAAAKKTLQDASASGRLIDALVAMRPDLVLPAGRAKPSADEPVGVVETESSDDEPVLVIEKQALIEQRLMEAPEETCEIVKAEPSEVKCKWTSLRDQANFAVDELVEFEYDGTWKQGIVTSTIPLRVRYLVLRDDEGLEYDNVRKIAQASSTVETIASAKSTENESNEQDRLSEICEKAKDALLTGCEGRRLESALAEPAEVGHELDNGTDESPEASTEQLDQEQELLDQEPELDVRQLVKQTFLDGLASGRLNAVLSKRISRLREKEIQDSDGKQLLQDDAMDMDMEESNSNQLLQDDAMEVEELRQHAKHTLFDSFESGRLMAVLGKAEKRSGFSPSKGGS
mmetsp:Transcript_27405/g.43944  ORF Transcript_27405/g.43944 Transcript_27405/m.43944 type:complete len:398 (+) Transcript_27405:68-1261(+)|eukprot:CAMPEP_0169099560 /NCGR_PEP_ID=MMETSP1015-20121227/20623_1 /TAXON_ID=342587 /ORGANISM="Karlodinium micrum, Strain CCMP2283" /LENGTH=397 /DNA_ID=CAMNT_0009160451 /DNA_START=68 /DNA_END=1261 /DNA_ORIENTATION=+